MRSLLLALFLPFLVHAASDQEAAFRYATTQLPHEGTLQKIDDGMIYLKVSDRYIYELLPLLPTTLSPPPYFGPGLIGANIPIICAHELNKASLSKLPPIGTTYTFTLDSIQSVTQKNDAKPMTAYFLRVQSPDLQKIRKKAGLPSHSLDILIGVQFLQSSTPPLELSEEKPQIKNRVTLVE